MEHVTKLVEKVKLPRNFDDFLKSDRADQVVVVGLAGMFFIF